MNDVARAKLNHEIIIINASKQNLLMTNISEVRYRNIALKRIINTTYVNTSIRFNVI